MQTDKNLLEGYEENNIFPAYYEVNSNKKAIEEIEAKLSNNKKIKHISSRKGGNPYELFSTMDICAINRKEQIK